MITALAVAWAAGWAMPPWNHLSTWPAPGPTAACPRKLWRCFRWSGKNRALSSLFDPRTASSTGQLACISPPRPARSASLPKVNWLENVSFCYVCVSGNNPDKVDFRNEKSVVVYWTWFFWRGALIGGLHASGNSIPCLCYKKIKLKKWR